jgi:hypothetical protein
VKKIENECVGCAVPLYPCMGDACPRRRVPHYYCDKCEGEFEPEALFVNDDGEELCMECLASNFPTVKENER